MVTFAQDQSTFLSSTIETGIVRWMSPELLDPQKFGQPTRKSTQESDCYALGMVVYEVLGGSKPYGPKISFGTLHNILNGERPKRPRGEAGQLFTDSIWGMVERCWKPQPKERASAKDVLWCLDGTPPTVGETDDQSDTEGSDSGCVSSVSSCPGLALNHSSPTAGPPIEHRYGLSVIDRFSAPRSTYNTRQAKLAMHLIHVVCSSRTLS